MVQGVLQMTRAFGDYELKDEATLLDGPVIALPEIKRTVLTRDDHFILLATDGVFDVLPSKVVASYARRQLRKLSPKNRDRLDRVAEEVVSRALDKGSDDNTSCIVCELHITDGESNDDSEERIDADERSSG